jgi:predicted DCC family thiol-disulfide oxidoreductase YuxK
MGTDPKIEELDHIVLYDGVCNFCNNSVQFIIRNEKNSKLQFASLQSELGQKILAEHGMATKSFDSIVFVHKDKLLLKSRAAFAISAYLKAPLSWLKVSSILPVFITDFFYSLIADNRYRWFGKTESCMLPTPEIRARFLDV